jgi:uncharacterized protein (TIGR02147 family)
MVNIFEYQNYRTYLRDFYAEEKNAKRNFSYRSFSERAGINSSSFLYYVIEDRRNLTRKTIVKISAAIGHSDVEKEYFENLVFFNQAETISEKARYYTKVLEVRRPIDIKHVAKDQYDFYSAWYHCVIRELVTFIDFKDDYAMLADMVVPKIATRQASESIALLERLGFVERDENGLYHQTDTLISVKPAAADTFIIERFQLEMLQLAMKSYDTFPRTDRMSASTTFSISKQTYSLFVQKTREFRKELLELARLDADPGQVFQFTFNLFPISRNRHEDRK